MTGELTLKRITVHLIQSRTLETKVDFTNTDTETHELEYEDSFLTVIKKWNGKQKDYVFPYHNVLFIEEEYE